MNILATIGILITLMSSYQQFPHAVTGNGHIQNGGSGLFSDVQSKLETIEESYKKGILTTKEYEKLKSELLDQKAAAQAPMSLYQDPQERFQFRYPGDWAIKNIQTGTQGIALTRGKAAIKIMPLPNDASDPKKAIASISQRFGGQWQDFVEIRKGDQRIAKQSVPMIEFSGANPEGMQIHGQAVAFLSGGKGYIFIMTTPDDDPVNSFRAIQPVWKAFLESFAPARRNIYHHPAGFSFQYPSDWTVADQQVLIQLVPGDLDPKDPDPKEVYFLVATDASEDDIQKPDDPKILDYLDREIQSMSPALRRTRSVFPIDMRAGRGVILHWWGMNAAGEVSAHAFVGIVRTNCVILVGLGLKERIEMRDRDLRQIFSSIDVSNLVEHFAGIWVDPSKTNTKISLGLDGSYIYGNKQIKGRWAIRGDERQGVIMVKYDDGNEETLEYKAYVEDGKTRRNEYWFNGNHYNKIR